MVTVVANMCCDATQHSPSLLMFAKTRKKFSRPLESDEICAGKQANETRFLKSYVEPRVGDFLRAKRSSDENCVVFPQRAHKVLVASVLCSAAKAFIQSG